MSLGGTTAHATIDDLSSDSWTADVRDISGFDFQPGLVMLELLDGSGAGLCAVGDLQYAEGSQVFPYREGPAVVSGKTAFRREPLAT